MKEFFDKFNNLKSSSFIGIKNYQNKYDEIANINLLTNVNTEEAKRKDLETLKSLTDSDLEDINVSNNIELETVKKAHEELIASAEKNLNKDLNERSNQSKGQVDAYISLNKAVKMHKETMDIFVTGFINHKEVIQKGEYPKKNKRKKTIAKEAIKKHCNLRMDNFRTYKLGKMNEINITGSTLQIVNKK
jgi:hypothetical protein